MIISYNPRINNLLLITQSSTLMIVLEVNHVKQDTIVFG